MTVKKNASRKSFDPSLFMNHKFFSSFDGDVYRSVGSSSYAHQYTYGLANYKGKAFTTGCFFSSSCAVKTELMDMNTLTWSPGPDYPFAS